MGDSLAATSLQHIVITRFNVRIPGKQAASEEWLTSRLALMRETMIPAIRSQTVAPDHWLVFCDAYSPDWFKVGITEALAGLGNPVWIEEVCSEDVTPRLIAKAVQNYVTASWLITTRVDNDDAISPRFLEVIRSSFDEVEKFINLPRGLQYEKNFVFHRVDMSNAFISFVEETSKPVRTVFLDSHHLLKKHGTIVQIKSDPLWMQIVHGGNIANEVRGVRAFPKYAKDFEIHLPIEKISYFRYGFLAVSDVIKLGIHVIFRPEARNKLRRMIFKEFH